MNKEQLIQKITSKKEFSQLPEKDVELVLKKFDDEECSDEEKVKLSRNLLKKAFGAFSGRRLLSKKEKEISWVLSHHVSTKERFDYYSEIYEKLLGSFNGKLSVIDLGCGVNGFSYGFFPKSLKVSYVGVESVGQFVDLQNKYFERGKISGRIFHFSLFGLEKIKDLIKKQRGKKIIFLFKVVDCLEMIEKNYSKKLLKEIVPLVDRVVVSFASQSLVKGKNFFAQRKWFVDFAEKNFKIVDNFVLGGERYIVLEKR